MLKRWNGTVLVVRKDSKAPQNESVLLINVYVTKKFVDENQQVRQLIQWRERNL